MTLGCHQLLLHFRALAILIRRRSNRAGTWQHPVVPIQLIHNAKQRVRALPESSAPQQRSHRRSRPGRLPSVRQPSVTLYGDLIYAPPRPQHFQVPPNVSLRCSAVPGRAPAQGWPCHERPRPGEGPSSAITTRGSRTRCRVIAPLPLTDAQALGAACQTVGRFRTIDCRQPVSGPHGTHRAVQIGDEPEPRSWPDQRMSRAAAARTSPSITRTLSRNSGAAALTTGHPVPYRIWSIQAERRRSVMPDCWSSSRARPTNLPSRSAVEPVCSYPLTSVNPTTLAPRSTTMS